MRATARTRPRTLRARLIAWSLISNGVALLVFAVTTLLVIVVQERSEAFRPHELDEAAEATSQVLLALVIAGPAAAAFAVAGSMVLARRGLAGIDDIVRTAADLQARDLATRLTVPDEPMEIRELAEALNCLFARLETGFTSLARFAADASHELRTPLAVLRSELEVAMRRERTAMEWRGVAERAHEEVLRLSRLVEALLVLARADAPAGHEHATSVDEALDHVARFCDSIAASRNVRLEVGGEQGLTARIRAESLQSAVMNVVLNAIRHAPSGTVVEISSHREKDGSAVITVQDAGPGIPEELRESFFEPFRRGAGAGEEGLGLGLTIARRQVQSVGGSIRAVDPAGNVGARFLIILPPARGEIGAADGEVSGRSPFLRR